MSKKDPDFFAFVIRKISNFVFLIVGKLKIDPNKLTIFSFIIFVPIIFYTLLNNGLKMSILSFIFLTIYTIIDMLDGNFARSQAKTSKLGEEIDANLDYVYLLLVILALAINAHNNLNNNFLVIISFSSILIQSINSYIGISFKHKYSVNEYTGKNNSNLKNLSFLQKFIVNIISPHKLPFSLFFTFRYYLLIAVILDLKSYILIPFAFFAIVRTIILFVIYHWLLVDKNVDSSLSKYFNND